MRFQREKSFQEEKLGNLYERKFQKKKFLRRSLQNRKFFNVTFKKRKFSKEF